MSDVIELTSQDVEDAVSELAALSGKPSGEIWTELHNFAGVNRDDRSLALAMTDLLAWYREHSPAVARAFGGELDGQDDLLAQHIAAQEAMGRRDGTVALSQADDVLPIGLTRDAQTGEVARREDLAAIDLYRRVPLARDLMKAPSPDWLQLAADDGDGDDDYPATSEIGRLSELHRKVTGRRGSGHTAKCPPACSRDHGVSAKGGVPHAAVDHLHGASADHRNNPGREMPHGANQRHTQRGPVELTTTLALSRPAPSTPDEVWAASQADDIALRHPEFCRI